MRREEEERGRQNDISKMTGRERERDGEREGVREREKERGRERENQRHDINSHRAGERVRRSHRGGGGGGRQPSVLSEHSSIVTHDLQGREKREGRREGGDESEGVRGSEGRVEKERRGEKVGGNRGD